MIPQLNNKNIRFFQYQFFCTIVLVGSMIVALTYASTAQAQTVSIVPASSVTAGSLFSITLDISGANNVFAAMFDLGYDTSLASFMGATEGDFLSGCQTSLLVTENPAGNLVTGYSRLGSSCGGKSGSGHLMTLNFKAKKAGSLAFTFAKQSLCTVTAGDKTCTPVTGTWTPVPVTISADSPGGGGQTVGDSTAPQITAVQAGSLAAVSAAINWTTSEPATSQVEFGTSVGSYGNPTFVGNILSTTHTQILTGLQPNTTYHFHVKSADTAGNLTVSDDFSFTTLPGPSSSSDNSTSNGGGGYSGGTNGTGDTSGGSTDSGGVTYFGPGDNGVAPGVPIESYRPPTPQPIPSYNPTATPLPAVYSTPTPVPTAVLYTSRLPLSFRFLTQLNPYTSRADVKNLQIFLNDNNFTVALSGAGSKGNETSYYGPATKGAVTRFQEFYRSQILTPYHLTKTTGQFGPASVRQANYLLSLRTNQGTFIIPNQPAQTIPATSNTNTSNTSNPPARQSTPVAPARTTATPRQTTPVRMTGQLNTSQTNRTVTTQKPTPTSVALPTATPSLIKESVSRVSHFLFGK